jgi:hypothetical protein
LPQPQAVFAGKAIEPLIVAWTSLASEAPASESSSLQPSRLRQIGALVLELKLKAGEVLRMIDPALADALVGHAEDVLEQQQPDQETACDGQPLSLERRDLAIDPFPVDTALGVDDLIQPGAKQIAFPVVSGFFGHTSPSAATTESRLLIRGKS